MTLLIIGVLLWMAAHLFKRVAPAARASMQDKMGDASKGIFAAVLLLSVVLMVVGFRGAESTFYWGRSVATTGINNLLMLVAVGLYGVGHSRSRLRSKMRHPMLIGTIVWAVAHILVNGDSASLVLFGGMIVWALLEIIMINKGEPSFTPYEGGSAAGDVRLGIITVLVFAVIGAVHNWLGYNPFGG